MEQTEPRIVPLAGTPRRIGLLGAGKAGIQHARAAVALGQTVTKAATRGPQSIHRAELQALAPGVAFVEDGKALLDDPSLDAIIVALPWNVTPEWLPVLLASPKSMLLEKPVALDAAALADALGKAGAVQANKLVGFNRRFYGTAARVRERLAQGGLKAAQIVISEALGRQLKNHGPTILPHLLTFSSAHTLDLAWHLLGALEPVKVYGYREKAEPFVSMNGLLESASGVPVSLALNADDPSSAGIRFLFDDHTTWQLSPLETLAIFDRYEIVETQADTQIRRYMPHLKEVFDEPAHYKPGFVEQMRAFLTGSFDVGATLEDALALQRFIEKLRAAGGAV